MSIEWVEVSDRLPESEIAGRNVLVCRAITGGIRIDRTWFVQENPELFTHWAYITPPEVSE